MHVRSIRLSVQDLATFSYTRAKNVIRILARVTFLLINTIFLLIKTNFNILTLLVYAVKQGSTTSGPHAAHGPLVFDPCFMLYSRLV